MNGDIHLTIQPSPKGAPTGEAGNMRPAKYSRRRAVVLAAVYLLITAHIVHWKLAGKSLAPLEFNEVAYTFQVGLVTAGFVFMAAALLATMIFGRFFCAWGCHILALEDLCTWMLQKMNIAPRPIRSRLLSLVPMGLMFYMFVYPVLRRVIVSTWPSTAGWLGQPVEFVPRTATDAQGWGSFVTADFWRNLPGPGIAILTLGVCGFAIVYLLGSRSFCTYVCPHGAVLALGDRIAPGRIRLTGNCIQCGRCTARCQSNVRVHQEILRFGKVVDSRCFKDLDCIAGCPQGALSYGFGAPSLFARASQKPSKRKHDFSLPEEFVLLAVFATTLTIFIGLPESIAPWAGRLYGVMPVFLSTALSVITAFAVLHLWRLGRRSTVRFQGVTLKNRGPMRRAGVVFCALTAVWLAFVSHSGMVQYHMFRAGYHSEQTKSLGPAVLAQEASVFQHLDGNMREAVADGEYHLLKAAGLGLWTDTRISRHLAWFALVRGDSTAAERHLLQAITMEPNQPDTYFQLARIRAVAGQFDESARLFVQADELSRESDPWHDAINKGTSQLVSMGLVEQAAGVLEAAIPLRPDDLNLRRRAGKLLHQRGQALLWVANSPQEAIPHLQRAVEFADENFDIRADLAQAYRRIGEFDKAETQLRQNLKHREAQAGSLYMLGELRRDQGRHAEAIEFFQRANALNPRFQVPTN